MEKRKGINKRVNLRTYSRAMRFVSAVISVFVLISMLTLPAFAAGSVDIVFIDDCTDSSWIRDNSNSGPVDSSDAMVPKVGTSITNKQLKYYQVGWDAKFGFDFTGKAETKMQNGITYDFKGKPKKIAFLVNYYGSLYNIQGADGKGGPVVAYATVNGTEEQLTPALSNWIKPSVIDSKFAKDDFYLNLGGLSQGTVEIELSGDEDWVRVNMNNTTGGIYITAIRVDYSVTAEGSFSAVPEDEGFIPDNSVELNFTNPLDESTVTNGSIMVTNSAGRQVPVENTEVDGTHVYLTLAETMEEEETYIVSAAPSVLTANGYMLAERSAEFTTINVTYGFSVAGASNIPAVNSMTLSFDGDMDAATVNASAFEITAEDGEKAPAVTSVSLSGARADLTLSTALDSNKNYVITVADTVKNKYGRSLRNLTAGFHTASSGREMISFVDDMTDKGAYIDMENVSVLAPNPSFLADDSLYQFATGESGSITMYLDGTRTKVQDGITYDFDGRPVSFYVDYYAHAMYKIDNLRVYVSSDNVNFTEVAAPKTPVASGVRKPEQAWVSYGRCTVESLPSGIRYIKIVGTGVTADNLLLYRPSVTYEVGSGVTFEKSTYYDFANDATTAALGTYSGVSDALLDAAAFTAEDESGETYTASSVSTGADGRTIYVTFGSLLDFGKSYSLSIADGMYNASQVQLRGTNFSTPQEPKTLDIKNLRYSCGNTLSTGEVTVSADITFVYHPDFHTTPVTMVTMLYNGDKLSAVASDTKTLSNNNSSSFSTKINVNDIENAKIVTLLFKDFNYFTPFSDMIVFPDVD